MFVDCDADTHQPTRGRVSILVTILDFAVYAQKMMDTFIVSSHHQMWDALNGVIAL